VCRPIVRHVGGVRTDSPGTERPDSKPRSLLQGKCRKGRTKLPRRVGSSSRGDREFESISLQRRVRLSPAWLSKIENPGFLRGCAGLASRPGRQRRAGCFDIAPIGGNISVGPDSSTGLPLMWSANMPRRSRRSRAFAGLNVGRSLNSGRLKQSQARSSDRARQAADVSDRGASLRSNRAAAAHRGSPR